MHSKCVVLGVFRKHVRLETFLGNRSLLLRVRAHIYLLLLFFFMKDVHDFPGESTRDENQTAIFWCLVSTVITYRKSGKAIKLEYRGAFSDYFVIVDDDDNKYFPRAHVEIEKDLTTRDQVSLRPRSHTFTEKRYRFERAFRCSSCDSPPGSVHNYFLLLLLWAYFFIDFNVTTFSPWQRGRRIFFFQSTFDSYSPTLDAVCMAKSGGLSRVLECFDPVK